MILCSCLQTFIIKFFLGPQFLFQTIRIQMKTNYGPLHCVLSTNQTGILRH